MRQTRGYARTLYDRVGQVNHRAPESSTPSVRYGPQEGERSHPRGSRFTTEPSCAIFVTKRKGFGSTGNTESQPVSSFGARVLLESFPPDRFYRYIVRVHVKVKPESAADITRRSIIDLREGRETFYTDP